MGRKFFDYSSLRKRKKKRPKIPRPRPNFYTVNSTNLPPNETFATPIIHSEDVEYECDTLHRKKNSYVVYLLRKDVPGASNTYIGSTNHPTHRFRQHRCEVYNSTTTTRNWKGKVAVIGIVRGFASESKALSFEKHAKRPWWGKSTGTMPKISKKSLEILLPDSLKGRHRSRMAGLLRTCKNTTKFGKEVLDVVVGVPPGVAPHTPPHVFS